MIWRFSDGTTVELGGKVEGPSLFAQELRAAIADPATKVAIWALPDGNVPLDVNEAAILHAWLEDQVSYWNHVRNVVIRLRHHPADIPALPPPPWADEPVEAGVVY